MKYGNDRDGIQREEQEKEKARAALVDRSGPGHACSLMIHVYRYSIGRVRARLVWETSEQTKQASPTIAMKCGPPNPYTSPSEAPKLAPDPTQLIAR